MDLPFRYQFILAPFTIVLLLGGMLAYTWFELGNINRENEVSRQWELATDRVQIAIASAGRLQQLTQALPSAKALHENSEFFTYLEQTGVLLDNLTDPYFLSRAGPALPRLISEGKALLNQPEKAQPVEWHRFLAKLIPALEHQYKLFAAQRRTAFINNHRSLLQVNSRMTTVLPAVLILCIALAAGLTLWGLHATRRRLKNMVQRSLAPYVDAPLSLPPAESARDELADLENYLNAVTSRVLKSVSVENVLHGVEHERRRISMDMHDGVLADLTVINRSLDEIQTDQEDGRCRKEIKSIREQVDAVIVHLRHIIDDLHPQVLGTLGLESALDSFLQRQKVVVPSYQLDLQFEQDIEQHLDLDTKLNLFRIITEGINNAIKHAQGSRLEVCLRMHNHKLLVTVEDNGKGLPDNPPIGHGCANISERARLMGATAQWRPSRFAHGTCFELTLALEHKP